MSYLTIPFAGRCMAAMAGLLLLSACAQTQVVDSWQSDKAFGDKPDKVAVIAVLPDALIRESVELDVARILSDKGTPAVPSSRLPGMSGGIRGEIDEETAEGLLRKSGVDGVVVMFYAGGGKTGEYVRSDYWAEYVGSGVSYGWGHPYFVDVYTIHQGANIEDYQRTAYVETTYFDMDSRQPAWRIVTRTKDTEHADAAGDIAGKIASQMRSAGLD